jgi:hypothetical protein
VTRIPGDFASDVRSYLRRTGWREQQPGVAGALWRREETGGDATIAVPSVMRIETAEWRGLTERLAAYERRPAAAVAFQIQHFYIDVTRFRAANDYVIGGSIPLTAGVDLVSSAYKMLRASATTARQAKAHIAGNFSKLGDQIVAEARLGHTEHGSYIVPVLVPLSEPGPSTESALWHDEPGVAERVAYEPPERRVTRTLAQALTAINVRIVEPAREPTSADMVPLVAAGASRELVMAVSQVLSDPSVALLEASFAWAAGATAPASVPNSVRLPSEAAELLTKASRLLRTSRRDPSERMTGPIVEVRHVPGDPFGEVALQTMRHGRPVEVRVRLGEQELDPTHDWMRTSRTIVVEGQVLRAPGRPLRVDQPTNVYPLDEAFLPAETR